MASFPSFVTTIRFASTVADMARTQFMPRTQRALASDELVRTATMWRRGLAGLPGGGVIGCAALPSALFALAVASRYDSQIAERASGMPAWLRAGAGMCFVSTQMVVQ